MTTATVQYTVATPRDDYNDKLKVWKKCRAVCGSEEAVKEHDRSVQNKDNFLVPFSPSMDQEQYDFLKREAELPGVSAEFKQLLVGGLLRKDPEITFPESVTEEAREWIINEFGVDGSSLGAFMLASVTEEIETTRGFIQVEYNSQDGIPYATLIPAEAVINWKKSKTELTQIIVSVAEEIPGESEFHPDYMPVMYVHELVKGSYQVRRFYQNYDSQGNKLSEDWHQDEQIFAPVKDDLPLDYIPIWPADGEIELQNPFLMTIVNKEIALYNKFARRNHILYGAATYTPYIVSTMDDEEFRRIVNSGLGSWLNLPPDAKIDVMKTPTEALADLDRSIIQSLEELAKLGVRMLSPETAQSGTALQLRNASQTARLGTLNMRMSAVMTQVIATMLNWRYSLDIKPSDIKFKLQDDFASSIAGEGWLRLATEWYENGHIPRSVWISLLKQNDVLSDDYDDEQAAEEIKIDQDKFLNYTDKLKEASDASIR